MGGVNAVKKAGIDELKSHSFLPDAVAEAMERNMATIAVAVTDATHPASALAPSV